MTLIACAVIIVPNMIPPRKRAPSWLDTERQVMRAQPSASPGANKKIRARSRKKGERVTDCQRAGEL